MRWTAGMLHRLGQYMPLLWAKAGMLIKSSAQKCIVTSSKKMLYRRVLSTS